MKKTKIYKALRLIDKIEKIRTKNNKNWMDILRISIRSDFEKTSKILKEICKHDKNIHDLAKKINKLKN